MPHQQCCPGTRQISEWSNNSYCIYHPFKFSWDLVTRCLTVKWIDILMTLSRSDMFTSFSLLAAIVGTTNIIFANFCRATATHLEIKHSSMKSIDYLWADFTFAPSQWKTALQSNAVSHWLGANLESALLSILRSEQNGQNFAHNIFKSVDEMISFRMAAMACGLLRDHMAPWQLCLSI